MLTSKTPKIDLHGEISKMVYPLVNEFIKDNYKLKKEELIIIHGKGQNILKDEVHYVLKRHNLVSKYYLNGWNTGETIAILKKQ